MKVLSAGQLKIIDPDRLGYKAIEVAIRTNIGNPKAFKLGKIIARAHAATPNAIHRPFDTEHVKDAIRVRTGHESLPIPENLNLDS